jgi:hypothetical protein
MEKIKANLTLILIAVLVIALVFGVQQCKSKQQAENKAERWQNNYYKPDQQSMTAKEFKAWVKRNNNHVIDSLNKMLDLKLRPKNITNYQTLVNNYLDTNVINIPVSETDFGVYPVSYIDEKECWGMDGYFNMPDKVFTLDKRIANDSIYSLEYFTQKHILWVIPIAKKQFFKETWSSCKGKISETKIEISKRPDN